MNRRRSNIEGPNELATRRRMIDPLLIAAGWNVGTGGKSTSEVGQEVPLTTLPTNSGGGYADYVLYGDDGKPRVVVSLCDVSSSRSRSQSLALLSKACSGQSQRE